MAQSYLTADLSSTRGPGLTLAYRDEKPPAGIDHKGVILLIHGFPQTSYQFRHVLPLLAAQGYRCIAPDYRGAGRSSKVATDFRKSTMAADMIALLDYLELRDPIHLIGHDIGGMIAYPLVSRWPERFRSACWGECPLPGTPLYERSKTEQAVQFFHFIFHSVPDLPEALIAGKERIYIEHFLSKITYNMGAFTEQDIDFYTNTYSVPGAMRCALNVYRAFEEDARENSEWVQQHGKVKVPTLILSGAQSRLRHDAKDMALTVTEEDSLEVGEVAGASHYIGEENPEGFVDVVLPFIEKHI